MGRGPYEMKDGLAPNSESGGFIGHQALTLGSTDFEDRVNGGESPTD